MDSAGRILLMPKGDYAAGTTYTMLDLVNHSGASWVCKKDCTGQEPSDSNTEFWQRFGTAVDMSNYLPITGGTVGEGKDGSRPLKVKRTSNTNLAIQFESASEVLGSLGFLSKDKPVYADSTNSKSYDLLHTGNKPTGTYTGNMDDTRREINIGGIGDVLFVTRGGSCAFIMPHGAITITNTGAMNSVPSAEVTFSNGILTLATKNSVINGNGVTTTYQVL